MLKKNVVNFHSVASSFCSSSTYPDRVDCVKNMYLKYPLETPRNLLEFCFHDLLDTLLNYFQSFSLLGPAWKDQNG